MCCNIIIGKALISICLCRKSSIKIFEHEANIGQPLHMLVNKASETYGFMQAAYISHGSSRF